MDQKKSNPANEGAPAPDTTRRAWVELGAALEFNVSIQLFWRSFPADDFKIHLLFVGLFDVLFLVLPFLLTCSHSVDRRALALSCPQPHSRRPTTLEPSLSLERPLIPSQRQESRQQITCDAGLHFKIQGRRAVYWALT
jgi:hypothetical protein